MSGGLDVWVVYQNPTDFPGLFVVRLHKIEAGVTRPTATHFTAKTLEAVRRLLPPGLYRLDRFESDDPNVVETWF